MSADANEWRGIAALDSLLAERVAAHFNDLGSFLLTIESERDARDLVFSCLNDVRGQAACDALGSELWAFATNNVGCVDRSIRRLARVAAHGPYKPLLPKMDPGEVYSQLVSESPHLGLAVLEKAIKARKSASGRAEHEDTKKRKWALQLAGYIEDAKLPAAERIKAMNDPNSVWVRAFGSRRANTLKNRCRSWAPVREWLSVVYGRAWPKDVSELIHYLDERHQGAPLGKTVPQSIMASIFLMEQVGQLPLETRLSKDSILEGVI